MENKVGLIGFTCPRDGENHNFEYCLSQCRDSCMSKPILRAMISSSSVQPKRYSITEIMNPEQMVYLKRNNVYYADPYSKIWLIFGNAVHGVIEDYGGANPEEVDGIIIEEKFEFPIGDCTLVGKVDAYDTIDKILYDYKTGKAYSVKLMHEGLWEENTYLWQLNMYKWLHFREAETLRLEVLIKDWSMNIQHEMGFRPMESIDVPIMPEARLIGTVTDRIVAHEKNANDPGAVKPCTASDVWFNTNRRSRNYGRPVRCDGYCDVSAICPQYKAFLQACNEGEDGIANSIYSK